MINRIKEEEKKWAREQIEKYTADFPRYEKYAEVLKEILEKATKRFAPLTIVQSRPKSITSFAEKILRKKHKYPDPVRQLTDLCGARIITQTPDEIEDVCRFIGTHFVIDQKNSIDVSQRLKPTEFGYRSVHYIVQFKPGVFPSKGIKVKIPDDSLFPEDRCPMKAEIQVKTFLEHTWAAFAHDKAYKGAFAIPDKWERELATLAAILESADRSFAKIKKGLQRYAASYSDYMSKEEIHDKMGELETVLEYDPKNAELANRAGKLAIEIGDWKKAIDILSGHIGSGYKPLLRDLGVAICKLHKANPKGEEYQKGQSYLEAASAPPNRDVDAIASYAGTWKGVDEEKARELYRQAFEVEPSDPYSLGNYLEYEITHRKDPSIAGLMKPVINAAIRRCRDQAEVGMNLPWAFYDIGKFHLLLGNAYNSLVAYAKAIQLSPHGWMIDTSLGSVEKLTIVQDKLPEFEWIQRLLLVGLATKFRTAERTEQVKKMASSECKPIKGPVVIVAGGCDVSVEQQMQTYRQLLLEAFRDFKGTLISGGTTAGISGLVGDVQQKYPDTIRTIGYVSNLTPADVSIDKRYSEIRHTKGNDFSALEPLQNWIDLISSGIHPSQVKLLGINGGTIAAAEYRIALALGVRVAVLEESGREKEKLLQDDDWKDSEMLVELPADAMTLRVFIEPESPGLSPDIQESIACAIHENYLCTQSAQAQSQEPSMAKWEELVENLKESNRQQADHIDLKLSQIGCSIHKITDRDIVPIEFTKEEIEVMAEMEHARWNVERFLDGWKWGEKKDVSKKISPYLVGWLKLPENVKEWDRDTVRKIPEFLAEVGLEVRRKNSENY
ncbi:MAG: hypothetical protein KKD47_04835 [Proteobacteria bacterium]|nr:hypothetical protein [Pseudomonadota bacterium]